ncbi:MAG: hypothetical protein NTU83_02335, partial [Candidatus Hydrogenedentes bacterium]|nr:hypothetical protein [Candidatus Hydrogenedentota bacterium]
LHHGEFSRLYPNPMCSVPKTGDVCEFLPLSQAKGRNVLVVKNLKQGGSRKSEGKRDHGNKDWN